ncbi:MAG: copper amine oxidase N-terminal domain-containing protein [Clostridia bacterium]|jgi:hypothetical protein|nr:copper amine oxidase N-terminal domain-containing protein [Clostridia bacterium]MCI1999283.1 copper amine oxidase N-terminal domain-containing protein [Clostridia bacterium]MCI2014764.1 copper amine oxidase N-terminal domain-containing protein [Clostridia bacterium]
MRKKLALLLAAIMVIGMVPMTAFATTTNRISKVVSGETDKKLGSDAPELKIYDKDMDDAAKDTATTRQAFELDLANAEWLDEINVDDVKSDGTISKITLEDGKVENDVHFIDGARDVKVTRLSSKSIIIEASVDTLISPVSSHSGFAVTMLTKLTDEGDATVTIDPMESVISSGTYKYATVASGSATVTVEKKADISEDGGKLKSIVIKETNSGAMDSGTLKFKLSSNWNFDEEKTAISVYPSDYASYFTDKTKWKVDDNELDIEVPDGLKSTTAMTITLTPYVTYDDDDVDPGDVCEMTVSGCGVDRTTLDVATAVTYDVTFTAEDKTVPTFYSGDADDDKDTLKVTMKEAVAGAWLNNRKTTITFPEGVKVLGVTTSDKENISNIDYSIDNDDNHGEVKLTSTDNPSDRKTNKAKIAFKFQLSIAPDFTGDITATLGGAAVGDEVEAVLGTAVAPLKVEADATDAIIDYRHTTIGDITITEAEPGILEKDKTLALKIEDLGFDDDPKVEVTSGDLEIDSVKTDDNIVKIKIKSESAKEPAVIKLTNCELYMDRSVPAGTYALKLTAMDPIYTDISEKYVDMDTNKNVGSGKTDEDYQYTYEDPNENQKLPENNDAIFKNAVADGDKYDHTPLFDTRNVTVVKDYVNVVTAGSDVGNTFTTQIKVTIGANQLTAGNKTINLDVPAYINNGYTMLPVRAVTEALSDSAIVRWDDATKTVTIAFGSRVVSMTVGSKTMTINGVGVAMQSQCEITDSRAFIPLRDLGYALGLNDSKINWDDATKTATLN